MDRLLVLTNNENSSAVIRFLQEDGNQVYVWNERLSIKDVENIMPSFIVSYNYNYIIAQDIIEHMGGRVINMHISLLPWNRGFSPNIWSFIDDTPKGVTIHKVDASLDTGDILFQKELSFSCEKETFATTYKKLNDAVQKLFMDHWSQIRRGEVRPYRQQGTGSYHCKKDLEQLQRFIKFSWDDNIWEFLERYEERKSSI